MQTWRELLKPAPDALILKILSFLTYEECCQGNAMTAYLYFPNVEVCYMQKPRPPFEEMIHSNRVWGSPHLGIVYHSFNQLRHAGTEMNSRLIEMTQTAFEHEVAMEGHAFCNSGFRSLVEGDSALNSEQLAYITSHFTSDWIPRMESLLQRLNRVKFDLEGYGFVICRICVGVAEESRFPERIQQAAVNFVMERARTSREFNECVYGPFIQEFLRSLPFQKQLGDRGARHHFSLEKILP